MDATATLEQARAALAEMEAIAAPGGTFQSSQGGESGPAFSVGTSDKSFKHGYWRNQNGYICTGGMWATEFMEQSLRGWTPLHQYGTFALDQPDWNVNQDPYRQILERGGAREFPRDQVLELGWHRRPPMSGIVFPQLDGTEVKQDVECKQCKKKFLTVANLEAHESVAHKTIAQNTALSRALAEGLGSLNEAQNAPLVGFLQLMASQMEAQAAAQKQQGDILIALLQKMSPQDQPMPVPLGRKG